jgi:hypothetical protein
MAVINSPSGGYSGTTQYSGSSNSTATAIMVVTEQAAAVNTTATAVVQETKKAITAVTATAKAADSLANKFQSENELFFKGYGELFHRNDGYISDEYVYGSVSDFVIEATFVNPYSPKIESWDYGFLFRNQGANDQYRLIINSSGEWLLVNALPDDQYLLIQSGMIDHLHYEVSRSNKIKLVALDDRGYLYVNDRFVAGLDLSDRLEFGDIFLATGIAGNDKAGAVTRYRDVKVWGAMTASEAEFCSLFSNGVERTSHSLRKKYTWNSTEHIYYASFSVPEASGSSDFTLIINPIPERSSSRCGSHATEVSCKAGDDSSTLDCKYDSLYATIVNQSNQPSSETVYCAFKILLINRHCGIVYSYDYARAYKHE